MNKQMNQQKKNVYSRRNITKDPSSQYQYKKETHTLPQTAPLSTQPARERECGILSSNKLKYTASETITQRHRQSPPYNSGRFSTLQKSQRTNQGAWMISCNYHPIVRYHNYNGIIPFRNGIRQLCIYRCGERVVLIEITEVDGSGG